MVQVVSFLRCFVLVHHVAARLVQLRSLALGHIRQGASLIRALWHHLALTVVPQH